MRKTTLIIDKRKELSTKYKKLIENSENKVKITSGLNDALNYIQTFEPDLILISDSIEENLADFCKKIRALTYNFRPIIVAISKSSDTSDKIKTLENGADDFLSEPINSEEFKMRINAHLRRDIETNLDLKTMLPISKYTMKVLKRTVSENSDWACLYITTENLNEYKEIYSELATDKFIQTFCAIINSALDENDFLGHLSNNADFLIITNSFKAEKIAQFLTFAFDTVVPKFYSKEDAKRGYTILGGDEIAGIKINFAKISVGILTNEYKNYTESSQVLNELFEANKLIKNLSGSHFIKSKPKISSKIPVSPKEFNKRILIIENDEALSILLSTTLSLHGFEIINEGEKELKTPAVIIIDAEENFSKLELCKTLKENLNTSKIIMTSSLHNKELVLNAGADFYLPKPYELSELINILKKFVNEFNR